MHYLRSAIYLMVGAVALGLLMLQPSGLAVPIDAHCELEDGQRVREVYRFDAAATPVAPQPVGVAEIAPTPEVYQYYQMPVQSGPTPAAMGTPTPCVVTLADKNIEGDDRPIAQYPRPESTPRADEVYHLSHSGVPDLEYELKYEPSPVPAGSGVDWDTYEVTVTGGEWQTAPEFAFQGLKTLLEYWQEFAAAMILVGVLALAWPW